MLGFAGVDGTGAEWFERDPAAYARVFRHSHVHTLHNKWVGERAYFEGPKLLGLGTAEIATRVVRWVSTTLGKQPIVLAGYSRGGAAAIHAAQHLGRMSVPVACLILFDAVDRTPSISSTVIPKNVRVVIHAMRDPTSGSRETFGNCGLRVQSEVDTRYRKRHFRGTHGALGGVPWTPNPSARRGRNRARTPEMERSVDEQGVDGQTNVTFATEKAVSAQVWNWVTSELQPLVGSSLGA